ncbi:DUF262 domain-containing protein [Iodobacter ciconiae]|uniref:DUF262 domain-containing protein n=1 Tax=Iodobacter ciconiae TaxID=2496266 RepID=A0A3S8ZWX3_9NEIS|nr:DUF262 domain-containing protein [Iodobacter ciconiae]AZN37983.1 DUF262 domain-containing protein [Iodobacter ciconiae]
MKIEANDKDIQEVFSIGYFRIPKFQRPYSWTLDEVSEFWNDIVSERKGDYFIGSMVVYKQDKRFFGIVDGQQRLTTITLLLAALRNTFVEIKEEALAHGMQNFIAKANIDNEKKYIVNAESSYPYLQSYIQEFDGSKYNCQIGVEEQNLKKAFEFLCEKVRDYSCVSGSQSDLFSNSCDVLKKIRDNVLSLKLVFIQLDNEDDAYLIFETLNARGKDLTTPDLVKNMLLRKVPASGDSVFDSAKSCWKLISDRIDDLNGDDDYFTEFLLHFWISKYGYTTDKKLFSEIKKHLLNNNANDFLLELDRYSQFYVDSVNPKGREWSKEELPIRNSLVALVSTFRVKQQNSMILSLLAAYDLNKIDRSVFSYIIGKIEKFHFFYNSITQQRSSGSIATMYSKHAIDLVSAKTQSEAKVVIDSLAIHLSNRMPNLNEAQVAFEKIVYTSKKKRYKNLVRYCLSKYMGKEYSGLLIDFDGLTIEHIAAQSLSKTGISDDVIGSIGNLMLISENINKCKLGDKCFLDKKNILLDEKYPLDDIVLAADFWDESLIKSRKNLIVNTLYNLPF